MSGSRLLLILEADAFGIPLQNSKMYVFKHGATALNGPFGIPTGLNLSGATWDDPDAGSLLSAAGSHLEIVTDNTGQKYVWMDSADMVDIVVTDNGHQAFPLGDPTGVSTFNNYMKTILPVPQFAASVIPSAVDFKVTWDGTTATGTTARPGGATRTGPNIGNACNQILADNSKLGPAGSENLTSPGVTIQVINVQSDNTAAGIASADFIGKPYIAGVAASYNSGGTVLTDTTGGGPFTPDVNGRLVYVRSAATGGTKDFHGIATYLSATQIQLDRAFSTLGGAPVAGTGKYTIPITLGSHIYGQGGGTRNQGNGHPDDGPLVLQCQGTGWGSKALIDFRNAPSWTQPGFGSEIFEVHNIALDANQLADYALVGMGVGTGNAASCSDYTAQGARVANIGIGNHFDTGGSSDVFHSNFVSSNPAPVVSTTMTGAQALPGGGAPVVLTVGNTASFMPEGYLEITSPAGTQLVHYTSIQDGTHFAGCIGGTGTAANGAAVKQWAYGFEITLGDVYVVDDFNIATGARALFLNQSTGGAICLIGRGHLGGGSGGGPVITIAYASQLVLGPGMYIDNIKNTDVGGVWIVPLTNTAVNQVIFMPGNRFNLNDTSAAIVFDGANGGSGTLFHIAGMTNGFSVSGALTTINGNQLLPGSGGGASILVADTTNYNNSGYFIAATDRGWGSMVKYTSKDATHFLGCTGGAGTAQNGATVRQSSIFCMAKNNWPTGKGIFLDDINARTCMHVWASDNATMPDYVGNNIAIASTGGTSGYQALPGLPQRAITNGRPSPDWLGPLSTFSDTQTQRSMISDGQFWWPIQVGRYAAVTNNTNAYTPDMAVADHYLITQQAVGWTLQAPTHAMAGETLFVEILRSNAAPIGTGFNAIFTLTNGGWTDPTANNKKRNIQFRFDGTNWIEQHRCSADY